MLRFANPSMIAFELALLLLCVVAVVVMAARRLSLAEPILLVLVGLGLTFVPGFPHIEPEPEIVLVVFLPPLLFSAAWFTPFRDLRRNLRPILLLSVGLVIFTTVVVGVVAARYVPGLPLAAALALGAIVSPPDALAATTILRRLDVPRRLVVILEGESLLNDATALVLFGTAVAAVESGEALVPIEALGRLVVVGAGSVVVGLVVGFVVAWLWARLFDPPVEIALSLLIPYAAYLPAERLELSGVIAVVTAGLYVGRRSSRILASDARVLGSGVWTILIFLLNGFAFLLIGLTLPDVLDGLGGYPTSELVWLAVLVVLTVVVARFVWVYPATYLPRWLVPSIRAKDPAPPPTMPFVVGWAGMRGAVSLAAALGLPFGFPQRDLIQFLTFAVIIATLVGQGLTLPLVLRWLGLRADGEEHREEAIARKAANDAALARLDGLLDEWPDHRPLIEHIAEDYRHRLVHQPGGGVDDERADGLGPSEADMERREHLAILAKVIGAEREAVIGLRDAGIVSDDVLRRVERELDLEELRLQAEA
jgi:CPA1 family monovalent cation:H+ antiporter